MLPARRTFILILAVLAVPFGLFLLWTQFELGPQLEDRAVGQLSRTARLIGEDFRDRPFSDSLADRLGKITDLRVTLISRDGSVIGDSEIDPARLPEVENHADRPEVAAALRGAVGHDTRASETIALRLLYVAVPDPHGAVRVATPLVEVREFLTRTRQVAAGTALLALILASLLAGLLHRFLMAPVERLASVANSQPLTGALDTRSMRWPASSRNGSHPWKQSDSTWRPCSTGWIPGSPSWTRRATSGG